MTLQRMLSDPVFDHLKAKQRQLREGFAENLGLRIHRALSWLKRAEVDADDHDAAFIFYWIAFNAAYAEDPQGISCTNERSTFGSYFAKIIALDCEHAIYDAIWDRFSAPIRLILDNKYTFQPFWHHHNRIAGYENWEEAFVRAKAGINRAMRERDTTLILSTLFDRLYVLRNQLIHGGATWNGRVNRAQVRDGAAIMAFLVPLFIELMMDNPEMAWGPPYYPVVD